MLIPHLPSWSLWLLSAVWWHQAPSCMETPLMPRASSSWKTWSATFSLSISLSRYCYHRGYRIFSVFYTFLYIFTSLFFYLRLPLSLCDVVPGHKQGPQQAAWLHCGHQDTQPAGWQRSWHVPHHWNTGGCQQQSIYIIYLAQIIIY